MHTIPRLLLLSAAFLSLTACFDNSTEIDQTGLCTYNTDAQAERCKAGQLAWYRPEVSNDQVALSVAAAYCDFNHQVMYNGAGVLCVFTDQRLKNVVK
ncbi:hypothetical protein NVV93_06115 [Pseudomonas sp. LS44]|uniref:hypothetical protein n=1 Tax=Pseudomonas sp. LS44 TaxID=1357074 RepID=UPI00215AF1DF|nr:hypothetical protein [Pseudomonas sp. LS44]UVE18961.1 hypothetical protein NVV93_06115 [Pseudomonas sp. LS44]